MSGEILTLSEIARRLEVPQHRLIHLCEKGVVIPDVHDASGRGSSREFSRLNLLEFAVALRLREMFVPVAVVGGIVHVLRTLGHTLAKGRPHFSLVDDLRGDAPLDLRVILSDGDAVFFSLAPASGSAALFGGIPVDALNKRANKPPALVAAPSRSNADFSSPEGSHFVRLELSVSAVARSLPLS
jgi:hypothetical protein